MKTILPYTMVLFLALGCASTLPQQNPSEPRSAPQVPKKTNRNATAYEATAWQLFRSADYVRALRLAYLATEIRPQEPSSALLVGLIYDHGFNRPDLALSAYNQILQQTPHYDGVDLLQPRLPYLFRRTQERAAQISLQHQNVPPLQGTPLALFPILPWSPNKTDAAFALGLTDMLLSEFLGDHTTLPFLRTQLLAHAYLEAFPNADAKAFAQWAGADQTLSGILVHSRNHKITLTLTLTNEWGQTIHEFPPVVGHMNALPEFRENLIHTVSQILEHAISEGLQTFPSSLALTLYGQALDAYLAGDLEQAQKHISGAINLAPNSERMMQLDQWIRADYVGSQIGNDLIGLYQSLKLQPNPHQAASQRILATQNLLMPNSSLDTAKETLTPFKPPQPETVP